MENIFEFELIAEGPLVFLRLTDIKEELYEYVMHNDGIIREVSVPGGIYRCLIDPASTPISDFGDIGVRITLPVYTGNPSEITFPGRSRGSNTQSVDAIMKAKIAIEAIQDVYKYDTEADEIIKRHINNI